MRLSLFVLLVSFMAFVGVAYAQIADTPWPMFMHDLRHTGQSPYQGFGEVNVKWKISGYDFASTKGTADPVIGSDGTIYIGGAGELFAFYPNGTLKWNVTLPNLGEVAQAPAIASDGTIYVTGSGYRLYALYPNGSIKWYFDAGGTGIVSSPAISPWGTIYFAGGGGFGESRLWALLPNGVEHWNFSIGYTEASVAISDNTIYVAHSNGLYAYYPNGTLKWNYTTGGATTSPAIASDGTIYVGSQDGYLYAFYPNGTLKWRSNGSYVNTPVVGTPGIVNDGTILFRKEDAASWNPDWLIALYPNGTLKWKVHSLGNWGSDGIVTTADGTIYVADNVGLHAFNPDGTLKWEYSAIIEGSIPAIASDGTIYVANGDTLWAFSDLTPPSVTIISPQNISYATSTVQINVSTSDPSGIAEVKAQIDGTTNITLTYQNGYYVGLATGLAEGSHWIRIYAKDNFSNVNSSRIVYFTVDITAPILAFVPPTPANNSLINQNYVEVNVSIYETSLNSFVFNWNGVNYSIYDNSLVLAMNFNNNSALGENSTFTADISIYENDGKIHEAIYVDGKYGKALQFDGVDDYIEVPDSPELRVSEYTFEAWVKPYPNPSSTTEWNAIITKRDNGTSGMGLYVNKQDGRFLLWHTSGSSSYNVFSSPKAYGEWYHIVGTYNGSEMRIYVNGKLEGSLSAPPPSEFINPVTIGSGLTSWYFNGIIDEVRIYNRALSEEEVKLLYHSTLWKYNSTHWYFYVNMTNLTSGIHAYYLWANDTAGNYASGKRYVEIVKAYIDFLPCSITSPGYYILKVNYTGLEGFAISINASDVVLDLNGFELNGSGILCINKTNVTIKNGTISSSQILFEYISNGRIEGIKFGLAEVNLMHSKSIIVSDNRGELSILLDCCVNTTVQNNTIKGEVVLVSGMENRITNNTFIGRPIGPCLEVAIRLWESCYNTISSNVYEGIWFYDPSTGKYYPSGLFGIYLGKSKYNMISNNEIRFACNGIGLDYSTKNEIFRNKIRDNLNGATLINSTNNVFYLNDFINNSVNVISNNSTNIWNSTTTIAYTYNNSKFVGYLGNHWDNFDGADNNGDGVIDEPYQIDEGNIDFHPLKKPIDNYSIKIIKGDFNCDGMIDIGDACYVAYIVVGKIPQDLRADFNGNERVDIGDLVRIVYYILEKIDVL